MDTETPSKAGLSGVVGIQRQVPWERPKAKIAALDSALKRVIAGVKPGRYSDGLGKPVSCRLCKDTFLIEYIGGTHNVGWMGYRIEVEATPEKPVYVQCRRCKAKARATVPAGVETDTEYE